MATLALVLAALGGCMSKGGPDTTGSLASLAPPTGSDEELRHEAETLGARYEANPGDASAALAFARVLRARKQTSQALAVLQQATLRNPSDLPLLGAYGKVLADAGRWKEASDVLARAHRADRPDWRILSVEGAVADQMGDFAGAQRFYEAALKIVPGEPSILSNQGLSYALARRLDEAETILTAAAADPRADARVRQNLALVLGLKGKFAAAEGVLRRDLPPAQVAENMAGIRRMVMQANSWKALRQADAQAGAGAAAGAGPGATSASAPRHQTAQAD